MIFKEEVGHLLNIKADPRNKEKKASHTTLISEALNFPQFLQGIVWLEEDLYAVVYDVS